MSKSLEQTDKFTERVNMLINTLEETKFNVEVKIYVPKNVDTYVVGLHANKRNCKIDALLTNNGTDELNIRRK